MRNIVAGLFISLDGVPEGPGPSDDFEKAGWTMPYFTPEMGQAIADMSAQADTLLLGRKTYQSFAGAFAGNDNPDGAMLTNIPKRVVSSTLGQLEWANSELLQGDVVEEVQKLKAQPGRNINISGSIELVQTLLRHGLIDGLELLVFPVVLGQGRRLFPDGLDLKFKLQSSRTFSSGVVLLSYARA